MPQTIANPHSSASPSFASLLASLAAPKHRTAWNNDDLADDVATLSYEHALRAHGRYKAEDTVDPIKATTDATEPVQIKETYEVKEDESIQPRSLRMESAWKHQVESELAQDSQTALEMNKKCASITIRLSKMECDQLHRRAAQAGLTVSAYLRSCTFEAEALRAQVKDVLAELRRSTSAVEVRKPVAARCSWFERILRWMPRLQRDRHMAQA